MLYDSMDGGRKKASQTPFGQPRNSQTGTAQNDRSLTTEARMDIVNKLIKVVEETPEDEPCFLATLDLPTKWLEPIACTLSRPLKQQNREFFFLVNEYWPEGGKLSERDFAYVYVYDPQAILLDLLSAAAYVSELTIARDGYTFRIYQRDIMQLRRDAKNVRETDEEWWGPSADYGKMVSLLETSIQKEKWTEEEITYYRKGAAECQNMRNLCEA